MTSKELKEKRGALLPEIKKLQGRFAEAEAKPLTGEEQERWKTVNADYDRIGREVANTEAQERAAAMVGTLEAPDPDLAVPVSGVPSTRTTTASQAREARSIAMGTWIRGGRRDSVITEQELDACRTSGVNPYAEEMDVAIAPTGDLVPIQRAFRHYHPSIALERAEEKYRERRALSAVGGAAGGYTVPESFLSALEINMVAYGGMLQTSQMIRTPGGEDLVWPLVDDTGNSGVQVGESVDVSTTADPTFKAMTLGAYKYSSKMVKVPQELLEDSAFDIGSVLGEMLGERLGRILNDKFTDGDGAATPAGIITQSTLGVTTASATAITAAELFSLIHSVDPAYRMGARFMMSDNTLMKVRSLADTTGQPLWGAGLNGGVPDQLASYPLTINQDFPSTMTGSEKQICFGRLEAYKVRMAGGLRLRRLVERYAEYDQTAFVALVRADGNLLNAGTAPVKYLQMKAA